MNAAVEKARKRMPKYQVRISDHDSTRFVKLMNQLFFVVVDSLPPNCFTDRSSANGCQGYLDQNNDKRGLRIPSASNMADGWDLQLRERNWRPGQTMSRNFPTSQSKPLRCEMRRYLRRAYPHPQALNSSNSAIAKVINDAVSFSQSMLRLSTDPGIDTNVSKDKRIKANSLNLTVSANFPWLRGSFPTSMIVPTQEALTCSLPTSAESLKSNNPFPQGFTNIQGEKARLWAEGEYNTKKTHT